jgi:hypothetical protein
LDEFNAVDEDLTSQRNALGEQILSLQNQFDGVVEGDQVVSGSQYSPLLGVKTTKKGKVVKFLSDIEREQALRKELDSVQKEAAVLDRSLRLIGATRQNFETTTLVRMKEARKGWRLENPDVPLTDFDLSDESQNAAIAVHLPKLSPAVIGINVLHDCQEFIHASYHDRFVSFIERRPADVVWHAPQNALIGDKIQPLSQEASSWLMKNLTNKKIKISSFDKGMKEKVAWRWLIISHNSYNPLDRIPLPAKLSVKYERVRREGSSPAAGPRPTGITDMSGFTGELMEAFLKASNSSPTVPKDHALLPDKMIDDYINSSLELITLLSAGFCKYHDKTKSFVSNNDKNYNVKTTAQLNMWLDISGKFYDAKLKQGDLPDWHAISEEVLAAQQIDESEPPPDVSSDIPDEGEPEAEEPPESFDSDGVTWFREDINLLDIRPGQIFLAKEAFGWSYRAIHGEATSATPMSEKKKGKQPLNPLPVLPKKEKEPAKAGPSTSKKGKSEEKLGGSQSSTPAVKRDNPLHVKGEIRTKSLSESQRSQLRKFFKLKDGLVAPEEWSIMTSAEKSAAMKERSIPRWASAAVIKSPANLEKILKGELKADTVNQVLSQPSRGRTKSSSQALEAWQRLRADFKGVGLLKSPQSSKEKAFRKRFDQLVAEYGEQKCFPRLRQRPDQQGRPEKSKSKGANSSASQLGGLLEMAKLFGEVTRALKG